jgi:integrase
MAVIPDLLGHHSVTLTEKYYAHLAPSSLTSAVQRLHKKDNSLPKLLPQNGFCTIFGR